MANIVLITSGQPSSNPRVVKEATALAENGHRVTVLYCFWVSWASQFDEEIAEQFPSIKWMEAGGNPESQPLRYYFTRLRHKVYRILSGVFPRNWSFLVRSQLRAYNELLKLALREKADLYIAHNLGALPIARSAAIKKAAKYAFDAEDFHRGEVGVNTGPYWRAKKIEDGLFPHASYITAASPMIAEHYSLLYKKPVLVVNNVFPKDVQPSFKKLASNPLRLVWFSQTVGNNRGIQDVVQALNEVRESKVVLTLVGWCAEHTKSEFQRMLTNDLHQIWFISPVKETDLIEICSQHHVGLALERREPINRNLCLTNKIFTYLLAGNAVIASDTDAQKQFFEPLKKVGYIYPMHDIQALKEILLQLIQNPQKLEESRRQAYELAANEYNWEREKEKFYSVVEPLLN